MKTFILSLALLIAPITAANAFLTITPSSIEFGSVKIGTQRTQMFFINNMGSDQVQIQDCSVFGAFHCELNCFGPLSRGQSCNGMIYFRPRFQKYEFEMVTIQTNVGSLNMNVHGFGTL